MKKSEKEPITFQIESDLIDILDHVCGRKDINRSYAIRKAVKEWIMKEIANLYGPEIFARMVHGIRYKSNGKTIV